MVDRGLKDAGYQFVVIDEAPFANGRDSNGHLRQSVRIKTSFPEMVQKIKDKGLKAGVTGSVGTQTCDTLYHGSGSFLYENIDAKDFADWGFEFIKYDNCHNQLVNIQYSPDLGNLVVGDDLYTPMDAQLIGNAKVNKQGFISYIGSGSGEAHYTIEAA